MHNLVTEDTWLLNVVGIWLQFLCTNYRYKIEFIWVSTRIHIMMVMLIMHLPCRVVWSWYRFTPSSKIDFTGSGRGLLHMHKSTSELNHSSKVLKSQVVILEKKNHLIRVLVLVKEILVIQGADLCKPQASILVGGGMKKTWHSN